MISNYKKIEVELRFDLNPNQNPCIFNYPNNAFGSKPNSNPYASKHIAL